MSRFLTPAKIGLLAILSIYIDSRVSTGSTVPVLSFLVTSIVRKTSPRNEESSESLNLSIDDFQSALLAQNSSIPGRSLWDLFLQYLWSIYDYDALNVLFNSTTELLEKSREELLEEGSDGQERGDKVLLSRNSPVGIFVRRSHLEFTRLQFHDGVKLWKEFVAFREPTYSIWRKRNPASLSSSNRNQDLLGSEALTGLLYADASDSRSKFSTASTDDLERILASQVDQMQKSGQRVSNDMRAKISEMLAASSLTSSLTHYSAFLDAWRAGDYTSAFDNLHRYFDYTMHISGRTFYHYALLNMAFLHADFGCFSEAISAIKESIAMARENKDIACLNYSLSWLYNFSKRHREGASKIQKTGVLGTDKEALTFIKTKAKESESWSLLSTCLLAEAELTLANGESVASAFESLAKVAYLNHSKSVRVSVGQYMITESSLYARLGLNHLEWLNYNLFLECHAPEALAQDRLDFVSRSALRLARGGKLDDALSTMRSVDTEALRVQKLYGQWMETMCLLHLRQSLHHRESTAISHYLSRAKANLPRGTGVGFEIQLSAIHSEMRKGDYVAALTELEKVGASTITTDSDIHDKLVLAGLKADIYDKAGVPQKGFTAAIRVASAAYKARVLDVLFHAVTILCRILMSLGEFDAASSLLVSIMPQVLECEDCMLTAGCFLALADAQMGLAGTAPADSPARKECLTRALEYLERAFNEYSTAEDVQGQSEAMAKRAMIMRVTKDIVLANDYASKYLDIQRARVVPENSRVAKP